MDQIALKQSRIGFHYYTDTLHYAEKDLQTWLPILKKMKASWLVLQTSENRSIPEFFIRGLIEEGISPVIHFTVPLGANLEKELFPLIYTYGKWGVHEAIFFDRPNLRSSWQDNAWAQADIVDAFANIYLPLANMAIDSGINPGLSPLYPGGSYWDTTFLKSVLEKFISRRQSSVMNNLFLSAYGWYNHHSLDWGAGGPQKWINAKPYQTPQGEQDHKGFRINEWYSSIAHTVTGKRYPIILLGAGIPCDPAQANLINFRWDNHAELNMAISRLLEGELVLNPEQNGAYLKPIKDEVMACCFYKLASDLKPGEMDFAWYHGTQANIPVTNEYLNWIDINSGQIDSPVAKISHPDSGRSISHYLLLPVYEWGIADWQLDVIRPFVKKYQPTIGFSIEEASMADQVTVLGSRQSFSDSDLNRLRENGCKVVQITGDGTSIATQMAQR